MKSRGPVFLVLLFLSTLSGLGQSLSLKLSGGIGYLLLDEVNRVILDRSFNEKTSSDLFNNWTLVLDNTREFHSATALEGELLFQTGSPFMIGLGSGIIYGELNEEQTEIRQGFTESGEILSTFVYVRPVKVNAIPLVLSLYYKIKLLSRVDILVRAGGGVFWAKYIDREGRRQLQDNFVYPDFQRTNARGTLLQGGTGISFLVQTGLQLFLEGSYRQAKASGFGGVNKNGDSGTLFYWEEYVPDLDFWQARHKILKEIPGGEGIQAAREAQVDFSGWSFSAGLIIQF